MTSATITTTRSGSSGLALIRLAGLAMALLVALVLGACGGSSSPVQISYVSFIQEVEAGNISSISASGRQIVGTFEHPVTYPPTAQTKSTRFLVELPTYTPIRPLERLLRKERVRIIGLRHSSG